MSSFLLKKQLYNLEQCRILEIFFVTNDQFIEMVNAEGFEKLAHQCYENVVSNNFYFTVFEPFVLYTHNQSKSSHYRCNTAEPDNSVMYNTVLKHRRFILLTTIVNRLESSKWNIARVQCSSSKTIASAHVFEFKMPVASTRTIILILSFQLLTQSYWHNLSVVFKGRWHSKSCLLYCRCICRVPTH